MNDHTIPILDLFSGIGGFALAAEIANAMAVGEGDQNIRRRQARLQPIASQRCFDPIAHAEIEHFACAVYHRHFPDSVCFGGVENITRDSVLERCGQLPVVVTGGFPCQPHSLAGKRKASADERDLWGECKRILGELRPRFALFENVGGLLTSERGLFYNRVLSDLAEIRFACLWQVVSAADVGAPHRRERVWLIAVNELADSTGEQATRKRPTGFHPVASQCRSIIWPALAGHWPSRPGQPQFGWEPSRVVGNTPHHNGRSGERGEETGTRPQGIGRRGLAESGEGGQLADTDGGGERGVSTQHQQHGLATPDGNAARNEGTPEREENGRRQTEPAMDRNPDGLPAALGGTWPEVQNRNAQLKAYGNSICPAAAVPMMLAILKQFNQ